MPLDDGRICVLIVDDNIEHLELCEEYLPKNEFAVEVAPTACTALKLLDQYDYDIVVLDYSLPDMDGMELLERIKRMGQNAPVIFVSAHDDPNLAFTARKAGACDYLVKSYHYYAKLKDRILESVEHCDTCVIA